jgi:hypothetical protein
MLADIGIGSRVTPGTESKQVPRPLSQPLRLPEADRIG